MAATYTLLNATVAQPCDGAFGFTDGTYDYIACGWGSGSTTYKTFWRSADGGSTWTQQTDFLWKGHTLQACVQNGIAYVVGGDIYSPTNDGDFIRKSAKFESGTWTEIASNCGIQDRCMGALVALNGDFYLIGGQYDPASKAYSYHTVQKSVDGCANFTTILSDTRAYFKGGTLWGSCVSYKGKIWKIGGGLNDNNLQSREHHRHIYSSSDGINWTKEGVFKGLGRHYHQCVVFNDKIWVFCGYNYPYSGNLADVWTVEKLSSGRIVQTYLGDAGFGACHALTSWVRASGDGILCFGGSNPGRMDEVYLVEET